MFRFVWPTLILVAVILALVAANLSAVELAAAPRPVMSLQSALTLYQGGDHEAALSELRRFLLEDSDSEQKAEAYLLISRILLEQERADGALSYLERISPEYRTVNVQLQHAFALQQSGDMDAADPLLSDLDATLFTGADLTLFFRLRAHSLQYNHRPLQALVVLHTALGKGAEKEAAAIFSQIQQILTQLSPDGVSEAAFMFAGTEIAEVVTLFRAQQALQAGDSELARQLALPLLEMTAAATVQVEAARIMDQLEGQRWYQRLVGVVLPLSGRYAPFGQLVKRGIELAVSEHPDGGINFIYVDSQANPEQTISAVDQLVNGQRVMAVLGPLTGSCAQQVATTTEASGVPLLTLSHYEGLPQSGDFVFRNSLTERQQAEALAQYAIEALGLNSYAILYPDNRSGQRLAELFARAVEERGGDVEHQMSFAEQATDFRRQLLLMKGEDPDAPAEEAAPTVVAEEEPLEDAPLPDWWPTVDFEALFVPAYADSVALLAPQLAYYGIENVQLLGINGWNSPQLIQQAGRYTRGAIFSDGFYAASKDPEVVDFVERYQQRYGEMPSILEAQGYDSANILLQVLTRQQLQTPRQVRDALAEVTDFRGVTGIQGFDADGEARRTLFLLKMGRRQLWQLQGLPSVDRVESQDFLPSLD